MVRVTTKNSIKTAPITNNGSINASINPGGNTINSNPYNVPSATEDKKGIIRIATEAEAIEGTDNSTAITPLTLRKVTNYTHVQGEASDTWVINHNLNKKPSITAVDSSGNVVEGAEEYIDANTIAIHFKGEFKGIAYLN